MEDVKWLLRRCGLPILLLLIFVIAGVVCWGKLHTEKQKVAEEVWEPPVEIENSEAETEEAENAETSTESAYWFIPQASDDLLTEDGLQLFGFDGLLGLRVDHGLQILQVCCQVVPFLGDVLGGQSDPCVFRNCHNPNDIRLVFNHYVHYCIMLYIDVYLIM